jgi:hypothetical protein
MPSGAEGIAFRSGFVRSGPGPLAALRKNLTMGGLYR